VSKQLTDEQKTYAALDAIKSLEVYNKLQSFPDLTKRLTATEAKARVLTNIVAPHGEVGSDGMGNVGTLGLILKGETNK
jgi:ribonuclease D